LKILEKIKPEFWDDEDIGAKVSGGLSNFRRIWQLTVLLTLVVTVFPLIFMTLVNYTAMQASAKAEILLHTSRLVSNTRRTVSFFLEERRFALNFIIEDNNVEELKDPFRLGAILENMKKGLSGVADLGIIDSSGMQRNYVGPYKLGGKNYSGQEWFKEVTEQGVYISDIFLGFRNIPHLVIAIKQRLAGDSFYVLRASVDIERFKELLSQLELSGMGDAFIINHRGILQTPSRYHGNVLEKISLPVPKFSAATEVFETRTSEGIPVIVGYAYITDTPFILMIVKQQGELMKPWYKTRTKILWFLGASITVIVFVILGGATYLVNRIHRAERNRAMIMHKMEYSNKMASLGRLAAGVAHEINNPLAIISEKAGFIKDMFTFKDIYAKDQKLLDTADCITSSVERCAAITRRLLNFARHTDVSIQTLDLKAVILEVLGFMGKEAEYRSISVSVDVPDDIPKIRSDRGKLQEIFLNVINNAFAALNDGGSLDITVKRQGDSLVSLSFADNGCGIAEADIKRIFEPFFSTKTQKGGTGLGLSITYGLVKKIGGRIDVQSQAGKGTTFTVCLPLVSEEKEGGNTDAGIIGG